MMNTQKGKANAQMIEAVENCTQRVEHQVEHQVDAIDALNAVSENLTETLHTGIYCIPVNELLMQILGHATITHFEYASTTYRYILCFYQ